MLRRLFILLLLAASPAVRAGMAVSAPLVSGTGVHYLLTNGRPVRIERNPAAHDPWLIEVIRFVKADGTNRLPYVPGRFVCTEFAVRLHDQAERAGLRAAMVFVTFAQGPGHALVAFRTLDQGLVYIDCTGGVGGAAGGSAMFQTFGYLQVGRLYGRLPLDVGAGGPDTYAFYEKILAARKGIDAWSRWLAQERVGLEAEARGLDQVRARTNRTSAEEVAELNRMVDRYNDRLKSFNDRIDVLNRFSAAVEEGYDLSPAPVTDIDVQW